MSKYYLLQYADRKPTLLMRLLYEYYLHNDENEKILDLGCGVGRFISLNPETIIGVELDSTLVDLCRERGFNVIKHDLNQYPLPFGNQEFSGIFASHIIEHLDDPLSFLRECYRILRDNGTLVIITPDYISKHDKDDGFWADYTHKRPFTYKTLERILYDAGFTSFVVRRTAPFPVLGFMLKQRIITLEQYWNYLEILRRLHIKPMRGYDLVAIAKK